MVRYTADDGSIVEEMHPEATQIKYTEVADVVAVFQRFIDKPNAAGVNELKTSIAFLQGGMDARLDSPYYITLCLRNLGMADNISIAEYNELEAAVNYLDSVIDDIDPENLTEEDIAASDLDYFKFNMAVTRMFIDGSKKVEESM